MGDNGPSGPCSEIFYDHGPDIPGGPPGSPEEDGDRFIEIWNLVFMQYEQLSPGERIDLPRPSVDTGMGLERLTATLQGTNDSFAIDLFRDLIEASAHLTNTDPDGPSAISHRVIADHLRSSSFLIADGVLPSNEGRGYVLRRIMRRAMRHVHLLGGGEPLLWKLAPVLTRTMGQAYPELVRAEALIAETLKLEETRFNRTLARGIRLLDDETGKLGDGGTLRGDVAFRLYDTYGFPLDLTQDILRGKGMAVDLAGFESAMAHQRAEASKNWRGSGDATTESLWFELRERLGATEFLGYATDRAEGVVTAIVIDGAEVETAKAGDAATLLVNQTPFYGESGGQVGDTGTLFTAKGDAFAVTDTRRKLDDLHLHVGTLRKGALRVGDTVELHVESGRRSRLRANHSATHLLHQALRRQLGDHVTQKGSLVAPGHLRFDFSHPKAVDDDELTAIERAVNERIRDNGDVTTRSMSPDEAVEAGAMALFGEKYGDEVRVVAMGGADVDDRPGDYSVELCGGIHVGRAGDIGYFHVTGESAVAAGVRRIEAMTGAAAVEYAAAQSARLRAAAAALRAPPDDVPGRVASLLEERRRLERETSDLRQKIAVGGGAAGGAPDIGQIAGINFIKRVVQDIPAKELKPLVDSLKSQLGSGAVTVVSTLDGKASLVVGVTADLIERLNAVELVRIGSRVLGGKGGGGRPDMAQAGGPDGAAAEQANSAIEIAIAKSLERK
jgi:alanyl-tRNA synthetase